MKHYEAADVPQKAVVVKKLCRGDAHGGGFKTKAVNEISQYFRSRKCLQTSPSYYLQRLMKLEVDKSMTSSIKSVELQSEAAGDNCSSSYPRHLPSTERHIAYQRQSVILRFNTDIT